MRTSGPKPSYEISIAALCIVLGVFLLVIMVANGWGGGIAGLVGPLVVWMTSLSRREDRGDLKAAQSASPQSVYNDANASAAARSTSSLGPLAGWLRAEGPSHVSILRERLGTRLRVDVAGEVGGPFEHHLQFAVDCDELPALGGATEGVGR
jgi:hypothetical protein